MKICLYNIVFILILNIFNLPFAVAQNSSIDRLDLKILQNIADTRTPNKTVFFKSLSDANNYVNIAIPTGLLLAGTIHDDKAMRQNALYVASSAAVTAILNHLTKQIFKRQRPFKVHINFTPVYVNGGYSLPSGHTSLSMSTATALSRAYPKWYVIAPSLLWAGAVGYSRMYLGVHNPSDVVAGTALGVGTAFGMGFLKK